MWCRCRKWPAKFIWFKRSGRIHRQFPSCFFSTQAAPAEENVEYPPIKPKFPPGEWGYMTPDIAWEWQGEMDEIRKTNTVRERLKKLTDIPDRHIWSVVPQTKEPYLLPYFQYLTKTHLRKGLPDSYGSVNVDEHLEVVRPAVIDVILHEYLAVARQKKMDMVINGPTHDFIGHLLHTIMALLSGQHGHLLQGQFDENVRVAAHWNRHGIPKKGKQHHAYPRPQNSPFQIDQLAHCQIRLEKPLPPFLHRDDEICSKGEYPDYNFNPIVMGLRSKFTSPTIVAGHWPEDPCGFGLLSAHVTSFTDRLESQYGADLRQDISTGYGLLSSFAWQVALAHYQGFSMYHDLTYPFCGQTILTNGRRFSFMAYQLNTLHLWKDDQSNQLRNICWHSEEMDLYGTVENGEVKGFNDSVLRSILHFLLNQPTSDNIDLKPEFGEDFVSVVRPLPYIADKPPPPPPEEEEPLYVK